MPSLTPDTVPSVAEHRDNDGCIRQAMARAPLVEVADSAEPNTAKPTKPCCAAARSSLPSSLRSLAMRAAFVLLVVALAARGALAADKTPAVSAAKPTAAAGAAKPAKPGKGAVGVRQQGDDFTDPGSQPGDDYVDPDVVKQVFTSASPPTEEPISQEFICSVFGGPSCPDEQPINVPVSTAQWGWVTPLGVSFASGTCRPV